MADGNTFHSSWSQSGMCRTAHCLLIFDHQDFENKKVSHLVSLTCSCSIIWCQDWRRNSNIYMRLLNGLYSNRYKEMSVTHILLFFLTTFVATYRLFWCIQCAYVADYPGLHIATTQMCWTHPSTSYPMPCTPQHQYQHPVSVTVTSTAVTVSVSTISCTIASTEYIC